MRKLIAALLLALVVMAPSVVYADVLRAEDGYGTVVTLQRTECMNPVALAALPQLNGALAAGGRPTITADGLHAASVTMQGKAYDGCWMLTNETVGVLVDTPAGAQLMGVPAGDFRKIEGI